MPIADAGHRMQDAGQTDGLVVHPRVGLSSRDEEERSGRFPSRPGIRGRGRVHASVGGMNQLLLMSLAHHPCLSSAPSACVGHGPQLLEAGTWETVTSRPSGRTLEGAMALASPRSGGWLPVLVGAVLPRASAPAPLLVLLPTGTLWPPPTASLNF